jgi:hypothetical protein
VPVVVIPELDAKSEVILAAGYRRASERNENCQRPLHKLLPFFAERVLMIPSGHSFGNGMTKKNMVAKRRRVDARPRRRNSVLKSRMRDNPVGVQTEGLSTIKVLFRRVLGIIPGDIRSFQLCKTDSGYHTVYLKDLPATDARRP